MPRPSTRNRTQAGESNLHIDNIKNPHKVTATQVGAYSKSEIDRLLGLEDDPTNANPSVISWDNITGNPFSTQPNGSQATSSVFTFGSDVTFSSNVNVGNNLVVGGEIRATGDIIAFYDGGGGAPTLADLLLGNLVIGSGKTVTHQDSGILIKSNGLIDAQYIDGGTGGAWGQITGTLSDQTDLQAALNAKANVAHTHPASDIQPGTFATGDFVFNGNLTVNSNLIVGGEIRSDGDVIAFYSGGGASPSLTDLLTGNIVIGSTKTLTHQDSGIIIKTNGLIDPQYIDGGVGGAWGQITGTLSNQTDLQNALNDKANAVHTHVWSDLTDVTASLVNINSINQNLGTGDSPTFANLTITTDLNVGNNLIVGGEIRADGDIIAFYTAGGGAPDLTDLLTGNIVLGLGKTLTHQSSSPTAIIQANGLINPAAIDGGTGGEWGSITGTLSAQTDLQNALNDKANVSHTHPASDILAGTFPGASYTFTGAVETGGLLTVSYNDAVLLLKDTDATSRRATLHFQTAGGNWSIEQNNNLNFFFGSPGGFATSSGAYLTLTRSATGPFIAGVDQTERMRLTSTGAEFTGNVDITGILSVTGEIRSDADIIAFYSGGGGSPDLTDLLTGSITIGTGKTLTHQDSAPTLIIQANGLINPAAIDGGVATDWGDINGTLSNQTDLQTALNGKAAVAHTHPASDVISGTFADARISQSSVRQHIDKTYIDTLNVDADTLDGLNSLQFLRSDQSDTIEGTLIIDADAGQALSVKGGTADHVYIALFADSAAQATRSAYIGFPSAGSNTLTINNEQGTDISLADNVSVAGTLAVNGLATLSSGLNVTGNVSVTGILEVTGEIRSDSDIIAFYSGGGTSPALSDLLTGNIVIGATKTLTHESSSPTVIIKSNGLINPAAIEGGVVTDWADITGKPTTFTPSAHTHPASEITPGTFSAGTYAINGQLTVDSLLLNGTTITGISSLSISSTFSSGQGTFTSALNDPIVINSSDAVVGISFIDPNGSFFLNYTGSTDTLAIPANTNITGTLDVSSTADIIGKLNLGVLSSANGALQLNIANAGAYVNRRINFENDGSGNLEIESTFSTGGAADIVFTRAGTDRVRFDIEGNAVELAGTLGVSGNTTLNQNVTIGSVDLNGSRTLTIDNNSTGASADARISIEGQGNNFRIINYGDGTGSPNETHFTSTAGGSKFEFYPDNTLTLTLDDLLITAHADVDMLGSLDVTGTATIAGLLQADGNININETGTAGKYIQIGQGRTADGTSFIDLIGDATYSDYGTRLRREAGVAGRTRLRHRGTGDLDINSIDDADINLVVGSTKRLTAHTTGVDVAGTLEVSSPVYGAAFKGIGGDSINIPEGRVYDYWVDNSVLEGATWKKICDVSFPDTTYRAMSMKVVHYYPNSNYGHSTSIIEREYIVSFRRSGAVANDTDDAIVLGQDTGYIRVVKTATGVYELQGRTVDNYRAWGVKYTVLSSGGGTTGWTLTPATTVTNGSTLGTVYTATASSNPRKVVSGDLTANYISANAGLTVQKTGEAIILKGAGATNDTDNFYMRFQKSDGSSVGYLGVGSSGDSNMILNADNNLRFISGGGIIEFDDTAQFDATITRFTATTSYLLSDSDSDRIIYGGGSAATSTNGAYISVEGDDFGGAGLGGDVVIRPSGLGATKFETGNVIITNALEVGNTLSAGQTSINSGLTNIALLLESTDADVGIRFTDNGGSQDILYDQSNDLFSFGAGHHIPGEGVYTWWGDNGAGRTAVVGNTQHTDGGISLDYRAYFAYDAYWNDTANQWEAVRTSLGRKWVQQYSYHGDNWKLRYYDGVVTTGWADSAWTDVITATDANIEVNGNFKLGTNATYLYANTTTAETRIHGINASNIEFIGSIDQNVINTIIGTTTDQIQLRVNSDTKVALTATQVQLNENTNITGTIGVTGQATVDSLVVDGTGFSKVAMSRGTGTSEIQMSNNTNNMFLVVGNSANALITLNNDTGKLDFRGDANFEDNVAIGGDWVDHTGTGVDQLQVGNYTTNAGIVIAMGGLSDGAITFANSTSTIDARILWDDSANDLAFQIGGSTRATVTDAGTVVASDFVFS